MLSIEELAAEVERGAIHTVVVAFPDMQGRLMGKRVVARVFLDQLADTGGAVEACDYLLSTDVEMNVLEGFRFSNWETGYGDMVARPDLTTLRVTPWVEGTAMVLCDLVDHHGAPIEIAPRSILAHQIQAAAELGYESMVGTELEFYLFR